MSRDLGRGPSDAIFFQELLLGELVELVDVAAHVAHQGVQVGRVDVFAPGEEDAPQGTGQHDIRAAETLVQREDGRLELVHQLADLFAPHAGRSVLPKGSYL